MLLGCVRNAAVPRGAATNSFGTGKVSFAEWRTEQERRLSAEIPASAIEVYGRSARRGRARYRATRDVSAGAAALRRTDGQ